MLIRNESIHLFPMKYKSELSNVKSVTAYHSGVKYLSERAIMFLASTYLSLISVNLTKQSKFFQYIVSFLLFT